MLNIHCPSALAELYSQEAVVHVYVQIHKLQPLELVNIIIKLELITQNEGVYILINIQFSKNIDISYISKDAKSASSVNLIWGRADNYVPQGIFYFLSTGVLHKLCRRVEKSVANTQDVNLTIPSVKDPLDLSSSHSGGSQWNHIVPRIKFDPLWGAFRCALWRAILFCCSRCCRGGH